MALLGLGGTWYHPDLARHPQAVARWAFLHLLEDMAPQVLKDLRREVFPAFLRWRASRRSPGMRQDYGKLMVTDLRDLEARLERTKATINNGGPGPTRDRVLSYLLAARGMRDAFFGWCEFHSLPPCPANALAQGSGRSRERWIFNTIGATMTKWVGKDDPLGALAFAQTLRLPTLALSLPNLPPPPLEGVRPWRPLTEPWDAGGRGGEKRAGYLHFVRETANLPHRRTRDVLAPYKVQCEDILRNAGFFRVQERRWRPHIRWFVEYQVLGKTQATLARNEGVVLRSVQGALGEVAALLPLQRRTRRNTVTS